ncbi:Glucose/arabinose dehydrogenase, beta-propeller fold [Actinokineospora alba]|uniref:Glucose/arabinose dehydrogenase, beta-propeller fold n=1 Tax=Actinokineospora alba TaxID=504798 RepID=A0A1H0RZ32_9PSEU|nr:PQQ-dependent sugar dehydrogenase [Actinokineospora alba]TDP66845.1 glucose/arabinose dehydrogenase [Actinokineospora alba]SDI48281.1 Glucose/arabinose dehydrogenase, beta-propeller fold [Actinokineospora alba]SDP34831.1 Glucose/arabinose dehydrogenase, beta-propeller fold [Actinokineospora alba]
MRAVLLTVALVAGCSSSAGTGEIPGSSTSPAPTAVTPGLRVETVASGLTHGWDIGFLPDGKVLVTQRTGDMALLSSAAPGATVTTLKADTSTIAVRGEGGLMGLVVHPDFATSREFTTCQTHQESGEPRDIRLVTWRLTEDEKVATRVRELVTGLPIAASGRHSGCRPTLAADGALLVGTGDTARGNLPQDMSSLGGKVLRIDLKTGEPLRDNPIPGSRVYTFGHRNVQGVALREDGQVVVAEHGPDKNDELNVLKAGANYGWDPSKGGTVSGYDESVPMTDLTRFPDAVPAIWQSGETTEAICAATFLRGSQWGTLDGALVVTALKGAKLMLFTLDPTGKVVSVSIPPEFNDAFGRLRAARTGPDGALYVTTSNGEDDKLLRVVPS